MVVVVGSRLTEIFLVEVSVLTLAVYRNLNCHRGDLVSTMRRLLIEKRSVANNALQDMQYMLLCFYFDISAVWARICANFQSAGRR